MKKRIQRWKELSEERKDYLAAARKKAEAKRQPLPPPKRGEIRYEKPYWPGS